MSEIGAAREANGPRREQPWEPASGSVSPVGQSRKPIDWPAIAGRVARALLGEPNARMSTAHELRYGRKGSLAVHVGGERAGTWRDFEAGEGGGVLDLVTRERGSRAAAVAWLEAEGFFGQGPGRPALTRPESRCERCAVKTGNPKAHATQPARCEDSRRFAHRVWTAARPLAGTVAERYLDARGVGHVARAPALRFHPGIAHRAVPGRFPALVAGVQDAAGDFMGIQRTYLAADGSGKAAVEPVRASLGRLAGGAVRLSEPHDGRLLVGEGIETTAAAVRVLDWRGGAWATLGTSGLRGVELPENVHHVTIAADRDVGGLRAAAVLARRLELVFDSLSGITGVRIQQNQHLSR